MERIIETARVRVRPLTESDLPGYQRLLTLPAVAAANGSPADVSTDQVKRWLAADRQSPFAFSIEDKSTQRFMGTILFYRHLTAEGLPSDTAYDLGYFLDPQDWGQGIMPEAIDGSLQLVQRAKQQPQTVWATCFVTNHQSQRVLEKLGFTVVLPHFVAPDIGGKAATPERLFRLDLPAHKN
ncbi:GNAT family N-acetyltransferase [Levilactobacillus angrenensis]|uniref:GNAT family N-acetyltransferase n=1 Tax=Levilactobacillus angrenensis TaxID=2486020 RepID=A0ABW1UBH7_9LACO|nr:GNAT family N-acetyltransferase [Levilactobacillus angrenensis]